MTVDPLLTDHARAGAIAAALMGEEIAIAARDPRQPAPAPWPEEAIGLTRALPGRRSEFAAGRAAARQAMIALGLAPQPIPMGEDRAPCWPVGVTGSISHTATACIAAVGRAADFAAVGLDLAEDAALPDNLIASVCTRAETARLPQSDAALRGQMGMLIFSAKECTYKAQYPITGTLLDFDAITIEADPEAGIFRAIFQYAVGGFPAGAALAGRFAIAHGFIVTTMTLRA